MDYPGNFQIPANPAGKTIAVSRFMAICTLVTFLMIIFLSVIILWSSKSDKLNPFMISANNITGEWKIVGKSDIIHEYSAAYTMQESVVGNFVSDWFKISADNSENERAWQDCNRNVCTSSADNLIFGDRSCAIYCASGEDLYSRFKYEILTDYEVRVQNGETLNLDYKTLDISPAGKINENGGTWKVSATIISNKNKNFDIEVFLKVANNKNYYPQTMGFYIADFNSYRISE